MEAVRAFNSELSSLYESRPPVSRAKMGAVTKAAIKAIKFYKHVVQSVEKFILKCKPEYKVPGLYVIDSVVRQSRRQFGSEKDVFGPRFTKNIVTTFQSLLKCPPDEKGRVVRVLNLWQKNGVFPSEVIQTLLDMAADPKNMECVLAAQRAVEKVVVAHQRGQGKAANGGTEESLLAQQNDIVNTVTKLLQQTAEGSLLATGQEVQLQQLQLLQQQLMMHTEMMSSSKSQQNPPLIDSNLLAQIKLLTDQLLSRTDAPASGSSSSAAAPQLSGVQDFHGAEGRDSKQHALADGVAERQGREFQNMLQGEKGSGGREAKRASDVGFNKKLLDFDYGESDDEEEKKNGTGGQQHLPGGVQKLLNDPKLAQHIDNVSTLKSDQLRSEDSMRKQQQQPFNKSIGQKQYSGYNNNEFPDVILVENPDVIEAMDRANDRERRRDRRSRDRSRSPRRRGRSRSRSRERRRSRDRHRRSRSREDEREREKERERKKKGLPPVKEKHISVCTTTLWFGHLAKYTAEEELRAEIEKYGTAESIKMVPPRGCAFVTMTYRKEAAKALDRMKGFKLNSSALRVAWAPNIGIKESHFKDSWDAELGVTYISWERLPANLSALLKGAMIDEDSLPVHLKGSGIGQEGRSQEVEKQAAAEEEIPRSNTPPPSSSMPSFGTPNFSVPPSQQQMPMMPGQMMMPPQGQMPPGIPMPGQMPPMPGQMMGGAQNSPAPQALPPTLLQPPGGPGATPMSLPAGMSITQMVSAAANLLGVPHLMNSSVPHLGGMDNPRIPSLEPGSPAIMMPGGGQQPPPGMTPTRPGLPPPPGPSPFMLRGPAPLTPQGVRLPFQVEEPKEWPSDDKLEEEALDQMEDDDIDQRTALPGLGPPPPAQLMPLQLMRMGMPGPGPVGGGPPPRMPLPPPGQQPHRPGMMVEIRQALASSPGMMPPGGMPGPSGLVGRPSQGMLGPPRLVSTPGPHNDGPEPMMRPNEGMNMPPPEGMMHPGDGMMRPGEGMMRPEEGMMRPGDGMMRPGDGMMRPGEGMMRPGDGMMRPGDGMMRPGDGMMRPEDGMMRPGDGMMRPGEEMMRRGDGMMRHGDGMMHPGDGMMRPGDGMMRPGDGMMRPGEDIMRPGDRMGHPGEGMRPGDEMMRPGEGMRPGDGMRPGEGMRPEGMRPGDGMRPGEGMRPGDGMRPGEGMRPGDGMRPEGMRPEGMMQPGEGVMRPGEGMSRPSEGMIRPSENPVRPDDGMMRPGEGMIGPGEGMIRPMEGMIRPMEGMMRPMEGMMRPMEGMMRPVEGMIRPMEGMIRPMMEGMIRPLLPHGLLQQGALGMRLRMSGPGPAGLGPANLTLGQRLGMAGAPGMRPPIQIVLGQRPNLVRPGGPFGLDNPRLQLADLPVSQAGRNILDDAPPAMSLPGGNVRPQGPRPMQNLLSLRASLADGRPGLLGPRPDLPMPGGIRFGPGAMNFRGLRPELLQGSNLQKSLFQRPATPLGGRQQDGKSPEAGEGGGDNTESRMASEETKDAKAEDTDLRGDMDLRSDTDLRTDTDLRPKDLDLRKSVGSEGGESASEPSAPSSGVSKEDSTNNTVSGTDQTSDAGEGAAKG